jgi:hypothetical protein
MRYRLQQHGAADADTLARVSGDPWLVAGPSYTLFASPLHPDAGNLPVRASFIPLLADLLTQHLTGEGGSVISAFPGATVSKPLWADAMVSGESSSQILEGTTFIAPKRSGVYLLSRAGKTSGALVVNPPAGEFDLERMPNAEIRARFLSEKVSVTADPQRWGREVFESAGRRPLILPFLVVALVALVLESVVSRDHGERRKT